MPPRSTTRVAEGLAHLVLGELQVEAQQALDHALGRRAGARDGAPSRRAASARSGIRRSPSESITCSEWPSITAMADCSCAITRRCSRVWISAARPPSRKRLHEPARIGQRGQPAGGAAIDPHLHGLEVLADQRRHVLAQPGHALELEDVRELVRADPALERGSARRPCRSPRAAQVGRHEQQPRRAGRRPAATPRTGRARDARRSPSRGPPRRPPWRRRPLAGRPPAGPANESRSSSRAATGSSSSASETRLADAHSERLTSSGGGHRLGQLEARVLRARGPRARRRSRRGRRRRRRGRRRPRTGPRPAGRATSRPSCGTLQLRQLLLERVHGLEQVAVALDPREHLVGVEAQRGRIVELLPAHRRRDGGRAAARAASTRTRSSCARRSGSSRSAPCPCAAPSSGSTRSASGAAPPDGARAPARAAWCRRRSPRRG